MTQAQFLDEFKQLSVKEQLDVLVTAVQILQEKFQQLEQTEARHKLPMAEAAQLLLQDYLEDEELTAFTALDGEAFHG